MFEFFADWLVYSIFSLSPSSVLGTSVHFFVYDTIKIFFLLFLITFVMSMINSYFPIDKIRQFLVNRKLYGTEYFLASSFGAITPFCSCSSVPLFIGFVKGGIPVGITFAFLITSPLVNEVAVAMLIGMFGLKTTIIYVANGIVLGMLGGFILGKLKVERYLADWVLDSLKQPVSFKLIETEKKSFFQRFPEFYDGSIEIIRKVWFYILIGVGIGALIHGLVPVDFFSDWLSKDNPFAVPVAVISAIPLYANVAGILPVIQVLIEKGIPLGTSLAFMMAIVGLSFPEAVLLKKIMSMKLIVLFFSIIGLFMIFSGYLFNLIL